MSEKLRLMFLCTGNSCRSQMAEGLCRALKGESIDCASAGIERHGLNPLAVKVMAEIGIDISGHSSKTTQELGDRQFDVVVTVCGHANETCPVFAAHTRVVHRGFDDPPRLAQAAHTDEDALGYYRRVRDELREFVLGLPGNLD